MKNVKEISAKEALFINGGVTPEYDENGNIIRTCTDIPGFSGIG
jgi:hypothetical protein